MNMNNLRCMRKVLTVLFYVFYYGRREEASVVVSPMESLSLSAQ